MIDTIVYGGTYDISTIWTQSGYNGAITLYYLLRTDEDKPDASNAGWIRYVDGEYTVRLDAGNYWVKAVVRDPTGKNYDDFAAIGKFVIKPLEITATITGSITYGDDFTNKDSFTHTITFTGILSGDEDAKVVKYGDYRYTYAENYGEGHLRAGGEYYIILATVDGYVTGITVGAKGNYVIKAEKGLLVVNKRAVTVNITATSGDYLVDPNIALASLQYEIDERTPMAPGEDKDVLKIKFITDATAASNAGGVYWIMIDEYDKTNYEISYQRVNYTINPLEVEISLDAEANFVYTGQPIEGASFDAEDLKISNKNVNVADVVANLKGVLKLHYTGTSYAGVPYDSEVAPTNAGVYTAQITGAGGNYVLIGSPSAEFTIQKQYVLGSTLFFASQTYTGAALTPVLGVTEGASTDILGLVTATIVSYTNANTYQLIVMLNDANNYQWESTQDAVITLPFTINKADDSLIGQLTIKDWQYGNYSAAENSPSAQVKSGSPISYEYSTDGGKTFTNIVPDTGNVGVYYVRIVVAESENYNAYIGTPVAFRITKYYLAVPQIIESEDTFTGDELIAIISNYDARYMAVMDKSETRTFPAGTSITAVAVNAGTYNIFISINDFVNYGWLDNEGDAQGIYVLTWTIGKMKVKLPTAGKNSFVVNGHEIVYIPEGFDESIMDIKNNVQSYGGKFTAVITLKDTANYEWVNGEDSVELKWHITGSDTLLAIILATLAVCVVAGAAGIFGQSMVEKRRKRTEAEALAEIESKDLLDDAEDGASSESGNAEEQSEGAEEGGEQA